MWSKYQNPKENKEERGFLGKTDSQYQYMMKEVYALFKNSDIINYCASFHSIFPDLQEQSTILAENSQKWKS